MYAFILSFQPYQVSSRVKIPWISLGCFSDPGPYRVIPTLEGSSQFLDGDYRKRTDPITKCYRAAAVLGYRCFALQNGGWCASSKDACSTYARKGTSSLCGTDGEGGPHSNNVYKRSGMLFIHYITSQSVCNSLCGA